MKTFSKTGLITTSLFLVTLGSVAMDQWDTFGWESEPYPLAFSHPSSYPNFMEDVLSDPSFYGMPLPAAAPETPLDIAINPFYSLEKRQTAAWQILSTGAAQERSLLLLTESNKSNKPDIFENLSKKQREDLGKVIFELAQDPQTSSKLLCAYIKLSHHVSTAKQRKSLMLDLAEKMKDATLSKTQHLVYAEALVKNYDDSGVSKEDKRQAVSLALDKVQDPRSSVQDRMDLICPILCMGTATREQKDMAIAALVDFAKNEMLPDAYRKQAITLLQTKGPKRLQQAVCALSLQHLNNTPHDLEHQIQSTQYVLKHGSAEQKTEGTTLAMALASKDDVPLEHRIPSIKTILRCGTPDQKTTVLQMTMELISNDHVLLDHRLSCIETVLKYGTLEQQNTALRILPHLEMQQQNSMPRFLFDRLGRTPQQCSLFCDIATPLFGDARTPLFYRQSIGEFIGNTGTVPQQQFVDRMIAAIPSLSYNIMDQSEADIITTEQQKTFLEECLVGNEGFYTWVYPQTRQALIRRLWTEVPQAQWRAEIQQCIQQYRPAGGAAAAPNLGVAGEIHNYASKVQGVLLGRVDQRLQSTALVPYATAEAAVMEWIKAKVPADKQKNAHQAIKDGLGVRGAQTLLSKVYTFVQTYHGDKMDAYLAGFVGESVTAYGNRQNAGSCAKGVEERIVIALRGIDFDDLFGSPEAQGLAKIFMTSCNFVHDPRWMVQKLMELGVTSKTEVEDAKEKFQTYGAEYMKALYLDAAKMQEYVSQVKDMAGVIEDFYEENLQPAIQAAEQQKGKKRKVEEDHAQQPSPSERAL